MFTLLGCAGRATLQPATVERFDLGSSPLIGERISLGGFSGLCFEGRVAGKLRFLTHTDRGPNLDPVTLPGDRAGRPFVLPGFQPRWVRLEADPAARTLVVLNQYPLTYGGKPATGIPFGSKRLPADFSTEVPLGPGGKVLPFDPKGIDPEGMACLNSGNHWMAEEYGPSLLEVSRSGDIVARYIPRGGRRAGLDGIEALPPSFARRRLNRGFEGVAVSAGKVWAFLQSPIPSASRWIRVLEFDPQSKETTGVFLYGLEPSGADRVGDVVAVGPRRFLVVEQNSRSGKDSLHRIYFADFTQATNFGEIEPPDGGDGLPSDKRPAQKRLIVDLVASGYDFEKVEGLTVVDDRTLAVINDDDFGLGERKERTSLGLIRLPEPLSDLTGY